MTLDYAIEHTAGKVNYIVDALSRMHKYPGVPTTKDDHITDRVDSTAIRPFQEITSNLSIFQTTLPQLLLPQATHTTICHPAEPLISLMSTVTLTSAKAKTKPPDTTTAAHILMKRIWNSTARMPMRSSRRRTMRCLLTTHLCLSYWRTFSRSAKPTLLMSIWQIDARPCE